MTDVTRKELAKLVKVAPSTVSRWEDDLRNPKEDELNRLARVLGVTPAWLRYGAEPMYAGETPRTVHGKKTDLGDEPNRRHG